MENRATAVQLTFFEGPRTLESKAELDSNLDWKRIARIVLPRFSELQPGERIGRKEIERRLRDLKETGFPVENYGEMSRSEMFNYLVRDIRPRVYRMAGIHCPGIVQNIKEGNDTSQRDVYLLR